MQFHQKIGIALAASLACVAAYAIYYKREPMENNEIGTSDILDESTATTDNSNYTAGTKPVQRNFSLSEYDSHDGVPVPSSLYANVQENMNNLQVLRDEIGRPVVIVSGYRSPAHNKAVGGVPNSCHLKGMATDIKVPGMSPASVRAKIESLIAQGKMTQGGLGAYATFTHYDVRGTKARWNG